MEWVERVGCADPYPLSAEDKRGFAGNVPHFVPCLDQNPSHNVVIARGCESSILASRIIAIVTNRCPC
jgi:hypothetical protein